LDRTVESPVAPAGGLDGEPPAGSSAVASDDMEVVALRLAEQARPTLGAEGFSDQRIDELAFAFVNDHVGEGEAQFVNWALAEGPIGLDPEEGF
jgi:hypothetical protein